MPDIESQPVQQPQSGGSYTRDAATGELQLVQRTLGADEQAPDQPPAQE